jgi:hypothetical protein
MNKSVTIFYLSISTKFGSYCDFEYLLTQDIKNF